MHVNVTEYPKAAWTAQQIIEAFPEETAPRFLLRDRDQIYGGHFRCRVVGIGIEEVVTAAQSPWQNPYAERLLGSMERAQIDYAEFPIELRRKLVDWENFTIPQEVARVLCCRLQAVYGTGRDV